MKKVLIVDDVATDRLILKKIFAKYGYFVLEATSVDTAIVRALADRPDLVCMDVVMPDKSGFQGTREFKKHPELAAIPVLIVSSKNRAPDEINAKQSGASGYVFKPVDEAALVAKLRELFP